MELSASSASATVAHESDACLDAVVHATGLRRDLVEMACRAIVAPATSRSALMRFPSPAVGLLVVTPGGLAAVQGQLAKSTSFAALHRAPGFTFRQIESTFLPFLRLRRIRREKRTPQSAATKSTQMNAFVCLARESSVTEFCPGGRKHSTENLLFCLGNRDLNVRAARKNCSQRGQTNARAMRFRIVHGGNLNGQKTYRKRRQAATPIKSAIQLLYAVLGWVRILTARSVSVVGRLLERTLPLATGSAVACRRHFMQETAQERLRATCST